MSEDIRVNISFPQYAAIIETEETETTITAITRCPLCQGEVVRQVYEKVSGTPTMETLARLQQKLYIGRDYARDTYWVHLTTQHPEHFGDNNMAS